MHSWSNRHIVIIVLQGDQEIMVLYYFKPPNFLLTLYMILKKSCLNKNFFFNYTFFVELLMPVMCGKKIKYNKQVYPKKKNFKFKKYYKIYQIKVQLVHLIKEKQ